MAPRPMRIVILIDALIMGGAERLAVDIACALDRTRFEPVVLVTRYTGILEQPLREANVPFVILGRKHGFHPRRLARAVRLVRNSDLLHAHKLAGSAWGVLIAALARRPLIAHEHIWFEDDSPMRRMLYRFVIGPAAERIVGVSEVVSESVIADGAPADKVVSISNGVRLGVAIDREEARRRLGLPADATVVGIAARLRPQKRHEAFIRAAAELKQRGDTSLFCILGDGPRRDELEALTRDLDVEDKVRFVGEYPDGATLVSAFDIAVMCSDVEGLPLAGLECMAAGVPLIATAVSALPRMLDGGAGVLVPLGDDSALADAIGELVADPERARAIGARGHERVVERYTFAGMIASLEELYDDVCRDSREG